VKVNSRSKGRSFEQAVARDLRAWLGEAWTVERNPTDRQRGATGSAGEFSIRRKDGGAFVYCIECKAYASWDEGQLWRVPVVGPLPKFWSQAVRQAAAVGLEPLLIVKRDRGEVLVVRWAYRRPGPPPLMLIDLEGDSVVVQRWADFLNEEAPE